MESKVRVEHDKGEWHQQRSPPATTGPKNQHQPPPGWTKTQQHPATLTATVNSSTNDNKQRPGKGGADESITSTFSSTIGSTVCGAGDASNKIPINDVEEGRIMKNGPLEAVEEGGRDTTLAIPTTLTKTTPMSEQQQQQQTVPPTASAGAGGAITMSEQQRNGADIEQALEQQEQKPLVQQEEQAPPQEQAPTTMTQRVTTLGEQQQQQQQQQQEIVGALLTGTDDLVQATLICDVEDNSDSDNIGDGNDIRTSLPQTNLVRETTGAITVDSDIAVVEAKPVLSVQTKTMSRKLICLVMICLVMCIAALSVGFVVSAQRRGGGGKDDDSHSDSNESTTTTTTTGEDDHDENDTNSNGNETTLTPPMVVGGGGGRPSIVSLSPTATPIPVLQRLREEGGNLRCGVIPGPGLFYHNDDGEPLGFDAALCAAVAAAANVNVEYKHDLYQDVFKALKEGQVDLLSGGITHTMSRQVRESSTKTGFAFTQPYLYQGMQLAGDPTLVDCGDQGLEYIAACAAIRVCVVDGSTHQQLLSSYLPGQKLIPIDNRDNLRKSLGGACNVIAHEGYNLAESLVRAAGYEGPYKVGRTLFSKEPLAMITASDDPQFSDFVNTVLQGLVVAEANNITQSIANEFEQTDAFGEEYLDMFRHSLAAGGNYGELYEEFLEPYSKRQGLNLINYGDATETGLLYSHPFGSMTNEGGGQTSGTLLDIRRRGVLRCGVRSNRVGFAELEYNNATGHLISSSSRGLEIDYCRALAGSIFEARGDQVKFVEVLDQQDGFAKLARGDLDVLAGATWSFIAEVRVPEINEGFSFTQPYFYGSKGSLVEEDNLCLATRHDDHQWSSFVYWISAAIVQAEETKIDQGMSNSMPPIYLFGEELSLCFQDAILTVGNQKEIYDRNLESLIPRSGRNLPNGNRGPELYPIPGLQAKKYITN